MKPISSKLKNKQNYFTPSKKIVTFPHDDNSFQVHEPVSSRYGGQKISIQGTPSTWYLESNRKQQEMRSIINLLSDSKVSNQHHSAQPNHEFCSIVQQQGSLSNSLSNKEHKKSSKIEVSLRKNPKIGTQNIKRINFDTPQKKGNHSMNSLKKAPIYEIENRKSRSISKTKRGISLVKNLLDCKTQHNPQPDTQNQNQKVIIVNSHPISDQTIKSSYCRHFFMKIYNHFVQNSEVSKYNFSCILLHEKLIEDLVKDRHFVNKIWKTIIIQTGNKFKQTFPMKIVFVFLISVLGHSMEEIQLFKTQQALMKLNHEKNTQQAIKIFKYFQNRRQQFRSIMLSRPKRQKSLCSREN